jgi:hypothetical protein
MKPTIHRHGGKSLGKRRPLARRYALATDVQFFENPNEPA